MLFLLSFAHAQPLAPALTCDVYPDSPLCATGAVSCVLCHDADGPPALNPYGDDVLSELGEDFESTLAAALLAIESRDSDADGINNLTEIEAGSWPGAAEDIEPECMAQVESGSDYYAIGQYDPYFAYKRITLDFCGRSPRYEEVQAFEADMAALGWSRGDGEQPALEEGATALLHGQLEACLLSPYWDDVLEEIGVGVVRPKGYASDLYLLGNYEWDLRLFRYATSGDRDIDDLMQADYFVVEEPDGSGVLSTIDEPRNDTEAYAQPLAAEHRFGLITTRFSLAMNVMFAPVPRTLSAHWYRELLGLDVALSEGLHPIDEADGAYDWDAPADVDSKGVWQEECAGCHTTLDPLSYPWARYNGIDLDGDTTGTWLEDRAADVLPEISGAIFAQSVSGPEEWVAEAVASDAFAERVVELFWIYLLRREPYSCEEEDYTDLWRGLRDGLYSHIGDDAPHNVEVMLHELVLMEAYGTP